LPLHPGTLSTVCKGLPTDWAVEIDVVTHPTPLQLRQTDTSRLRTTQKRVDWILKG